MLESVCCTSMSIQLGLRLRAMSKQTAKSTLSERPQVHPSPELLNLLWPPFCPASAADPVPITVPLNPS